MCDACEDEDGGDGDAGADEVDAWVAGDDVDGTAVDAAIERHVLAPLRRTRAASVPAGLLSRQQAWSLAHASEHVASTDGEMVDPWDDDEDSPQPPPTVTPETRRTRDAIERTLGVIFSASSNSDCSIGELMHALRAAGFRYRRAHVDAILHAMDAERGGTIMYRDGRIHLI